MAPSVATRSSDCKLELIDDGRLRVCFCREKDCCFLGGGTYGKVFKATDINQWEEGEEAVAIKCLSNECQVDYEIANLKSANHRNILKYYREFKIGPHRYVEYVSRRSKL